MAVRILLADDHALMREGLRLVLSRHTDLVVVGEAVDGRDAIRLVGELRPDIVIMDITMPGMNGIEATAWIRKNYPSTQVVILSMHVTTEYIHRAVKSGALGYVLKQSAGKEVLDAIRTVQSGRLYLSGRIADIAPDFYISIRNELSLKSPLECLSSREREILQLVVEGKSSADIGKVMNLARTTVETYRSRLMTKLQIKNVPDLVKFAVEHGLTPLGG